MVYSAISMRNCLLGPRLMLQNFCKNCRQDGTVIPADERMRWLSDHNQGGTTAPATENSFGASEGNESRSSTHQESALQICFVDSLISENLSLT